MTKKIVKKHTPLFGQRLPNKEYRAKYYKMRWEMDPEYRQKNLERGKKRYQMMKEAFDKFRADIETKEYL